MTFEDQVRGLGAAAESELVPFTLTLVHHGKGDFIGLALAACTLSPIFLVVSYVTLIVALRFPFKLVFVFMGQLGNVALNVVLKHILRMPRPQGKPHLEHFGRFGMPSNHSQFMYFIAGFTLLAALRGTVSAREFPYQILLCLFFQGLAAVVAFSRVYLEYHSTDQVVVGAIAGFVVGAIWHEMFAAIFSVDRSSLGKKRD